MSLRAKIFIRVTGLVLGLIVMVTWLACAFSVRNQRESTLTLVRRQLLALSEQAAELVAWDDRLELKNLLDEAVAADQGLAYAMLQRGGRPYVHTFPDAVPRGLLALAPGAGGGQAVYEIQSTAGQRFLHVVTPLPAGSAVLHAGLSEAEISRQVRPQILAIAILGGCAACLGILFAWAAARLITREVAETTAALRAEVEKHKQTRQELALHRDRLEQLVQERTRALEQATEELRREHDTAVFERRRFMTMVDAIHSGIVFFGVDGRVQHVNPAARNILGLAEGEVPATVVEPGVLEGSNRDGAGILERWLGPDAWKRINERRELEIVVATVQHEDRTLAGHVLIVRDRTAEKRMQRLMAEQERIASLGTLAAGIAHEINNPLDGLQNCLRRIIRDPTNTDQIERYAGLMTASLHHIETVVRQLLNLSHKRDRSLRPVSINAVLREAIELALAGQQRPDVKIAWQLADDLPPVLADPQNMTQVFLNLALNALRAMPAGGRLTLRTRLLSAGPNRSDDYVLVEVADTGVGMAPEVQARVFEPFFTTSEDGKGTGLGLTVTRNLVIEHGGEIEVESEPGRGTTFRIRLPRHFAAQRLAAARARDG